MKPQSAKAKGRELQKKVRDLILSRFPGLKENDVRSTSMGAQGEDIQLSTAALQCIPFYIEAKSRHKIAIYPWYEQGKTNINRLLVLKENRKKPLVVLDAEVFFDLLKELNEIKTIKNK